MNVDNNWIIEFPTELFMLVKTRAQSVIDSSVYRTEFSDAYWTMDEVINAEPIFPTIFMFFNMNEMGRDIEGIDINAVMCMCQVDITVSKKQGLSGGRYLAGVIMNEFKKLGFEIQEAPYFDDNTNDLKRMIFRARRLIGQADIINS